MFQLSHDPMLNNSDAQDIARLIYTDLNATPREIALAARVEDLVEEVACHAGELEERDEAHAEELADAKAEAKGLEEQLEEREREHERAYDELREECDAAESRVVELEARVKELDEECDALHFAPRYSPFGLACNVMRKAA